MNNKVNYTLVGFFVLLGMVSMFAFTYWLLKPSEETQTQKYLIYFNESVLGLNMNAPVKYRGIAVGKVTSLRISPKNTEQVEVIVDILKTTPIKEDTVAKLTAQGITGLTYINLTLGSNNAPPLQAKKGEKYPVIKTAPSFFEHFEKSLGSVSSHLTLSLLRIEELLNEKNQKEFIGLIQNTSKSMGKIDKLLDEQTILHLQNSAKNIDAFTYKLDKIMPNVDAFLDKSQVFEQSVSDSLASIMESYLSIKESMDAMKQPFKDGQFDFKDMADTLLPTMNATLLEMQELMIKVNGFLEHYEESPSDILYKEQELKKAPGEL
jgi:phospholipid/cholesterol/gamma-HCH transport system substrate-binding protein